MLLRPLQLLLLLVGVSPHLRHVALGGRPRVDRLDRRGDPETHPPNNESTTGMRISPWPSPKTMMPKNILKNVRKTVELERISGEMPRKVVSPPSSTGGPISCSIPATASSPDAAVRLCKSNNQFNLTTSR